MKISPSQIRKYLDCEFAAYAEYVELLEPIGQAARFAFGKAVHALMDPALRVHWASGGSKPAVLDAMSGDTGKAVAREAFEALHAEDGTVIDEETARRAFEVTRWNLERMDLDHWETLSVDRPHYETTINGDEKCVAPAPTPAVELTLECELAPGLTLQGRIDWIARHRPSGLVFVIDHKTTKSKFDATKLVEHDLQLALYRYVCERNGIDIDGALINLMRDKVPRAPTPIKSKPGMSRALISTTWEVYRETLIAHGLDPEDYADQRERYAGAMFRGYFRDVSSARSRARAVSVAHRVGLRRAEQQRTLCDLQLFNRRPTRSCDGCDYKAWCDAQFDGLPPAPLLGTVYLPKAGSPWRTDQTLHGDTALREHEDRLARQGRFSTAATIFNPKDHQ